MVSILSIVAVLLIASAPALGSVRPVPAFASSGSDSAFGSFGPVFSSAPGSAKIDRNVTTNIIANYGDSLQFECYASGDPTPTISWSKSGGNGLLPNGEQKYGRNILHFPSVTRESQGIYACEASNKNSYDVVYYTLHVESKPLITEISQKNVFGSHITLHCIASMNPKSTFKWYRNGELLSSEDQSNVGHPYIFVPSDSVFGSLDISTQNNDFEGSYKCEIENEFGKDEQVFEINAPA